MTESEQTRIMAQAECWFHLRGERHAEARRQIRALLKNLNFKKVLAALRSQSARGGFDLQVPAIFATLNGLAEDQRIRLRHEAASRERQREREEWEREKP